MDKIESAGVVLVAFVAAGYLLTGAKGLEMSRTARYVIASILFAIGLLQLTALMRVPPAKGGAGITDRVWNLTDEKP